MRSQSRRTQSRRTQRALETELFGSSYKPVLSFMPTRTTPPPIPTGIPGNCWACGNTCSPVVEWTCPHCNVRYPTV